MINFKHKQQKRENTLVVSEEKPEEYCGTSQNSYLAKLNNFASKWDGSMDEKLPIFVRFEGSQSPEY